MGVLLPVVSPSPRARLRGHSAAAPCARDGVSNANAPATATDRPAAARRPGDRTVWLPSIGAPPAFPDPRRLAPAFPCPSLRLLSCHAGVTADNAGCRSLGGIGRAGAVRPGRRPCHAAAALPGILGGDAQPQHLQDVL